jgi:hypothetical protein
VSRRKRQALLTTISTLTLLVVFALGTATAAPPTEPRMNQIEIDAKCTTDGQSFTDYTFVINGMAKTGLLIDSTDKNIVFTSYTVTYYAEGSEIGTDEFNSGAKRDDILSCSGEVTTDLEGIGDNVTAVFESQGFLAPG